MQNTKVPKVTFYLLKHMISQVSWQVMYGWCVVTGCANADTNTLSHPGNVLSARYNQTTAGNPPPAKKLCAFPPLKHIHFLRGLQVLWEWQMVTSIPLHKFIFYLQKVKKVLSAHNKCLNVLRLAFTKQNVIFWERFIAIYIDAQNKRELEGRSEGSPFPSISYFWGPLVLNVWRIPTKAWVEIMLNTFWHI